MSEMQFCYCCRVHHPKDQMQSFTTRHGPRWRCLRSIEAATRSVQERDSFGRQQTAINRAKAERTARYSTTLSGRNRNAL
jgi:hypothetical protein